MSVCINHISIYLPDSKLSNADLANELCVSEEQIFKNTHINNRYVSSKDELSSDMAIKAGNKLFNEAKLDKSEIDFLIFCSEGFDYIAPATSCIIQHKLGLSTNIGCFEIIIS
jgi:3-oxoacyl-[acyl-carrier-protein] synthase-3